MFETTAAVMPKRPGRPTGKPKARQERAADDQDRQPMIVQMRGSQEFKEYVHRGAEFSRNTVAKVAEIALIQYFKSIGFTEEPPKR